jgi:hypothetical protein
VRVLAVELGLNIKIIGSTTLDRSDLGRGSELDNAYCIQNQPLVAGRTVDIAIDSSIISLRRLRIFAPHLYSIPLLNQMPRCHPFALHSTNLLGAQSVNAAPPAILKPQYLSQFV